VGQLKYIELFAGIGGFRHGLEACNNRYQTGGESENLSGRKPGATEYTIQGATFSCVYANEWDGYAAGIYRRHYGEIDTRDITTVNVSEIPEHDLLTAGFPCQAFSVAGKGLGFEDTRGTLFFEIARICERKRPRHVLLENVKGLLSHEEGKTFQTILGVLADLGYRVEWMVLNSKHFGVPQNRERVFIVGHLRGECRGEVFPLRGKNEGAGGQIVSTAIDGNYGKGIDNHGQRTMIQITDPGTMQGYRVYDPEGVSSTIAGNAGGVGAKTGLYAVKDEARIRRLTPTECERLQAFPDGWTKWGLLEDGMEIEISDTQRYKCLGNAVTTSVITAIGQKLLEHIGEDECATTSRKNLNQGGSDASKC